MKGQPNFFEGLAGVSKNGKWGFVDRTGNLVIEMMYDSVLYFQDGVAAVELGGEYFYIDKWGNKIEKADDNTQNLFEIRQILNKYQ